MIDHIGNGFNNDVSLYSDERWLELIITCSIKCSRFGTLHSRPKQCKHVLDFSWNPSWNLLKISSVKFVDTL